MNEQLNVWLKESKQALQELDPDSEEYKHLNAFVLRLEQVLLQETLEASAEGNRFDLDQLKTDIVALEISHPRVTGILNDLLVTLSGMGI